MNASATTLAEPFSEVPGLAARMAQFARLLRDNGFGINQKDVGDIFRFMTIKDALKEQRFKKILKVVFCKSRSDLARFDEIFDAYWRERVGKKTTIKSQVPLDKSGRSAKQESLPTAVAKGLAQYFEWRKAQDKDDKDAGLESQGDQQVSAARLGGASSHGGASTLDAGKVDDGDDAKRLWAFAETLGRQMRYRISRRRKVSAKGNRADLRRSLRKVLETGGMPLRLIKRTRKEPPVKLLMFVDVSGSMDAYSLFFTRFVHALTGGFRHAEAFLFHTRLAHISDALKEANPLKMMEKITLISQGWSGGTKIGASLAAFNKQYAKDYASSRTVAVIMSDGYDTGAPEQLVQELQVLKRRCHKVIWLNPMLGREGYAPETNAMQKALPLIDLFAPAHNLRSLLLLEKALVRV